jgi:hypothetical protein
MKYERPELTPLAFAADAIQGSKNKALTMFSDSRQPATSAAYEADE